MTIGQLPTLHSRQIYCNNVEKGYDEEFKDLLSISKENTIFDIINDNTGSLKKFMSIFKSTDRERQDLQSVVRNTIREWTQKLTARTFQVIYKPEELRLFQGTVRKISSEAKIVFLRAQIQERKIFADEIDRELEYLKQLVINILSLQPAQKIPATSPILSRKVSSISSSSLPLTGATNIFKTLPIQYSIPRLNTSSSSEGFCESPSYEIHSSALYMDQENDKKKHSDENLVSSLLGCSPQLSGDWLKRLVNGFRTLDTKENVIALGKRIKPYQAIQIIDQTRNSYDQHWKIVYLLGSLKFETFKSVVQGLEREHLEHLNRILINADSESNK